MYRKIALIGGTAAVVLGAGTAALATTGGDSSSATTGSPASSTASASTTDAGVLALARFAKRHPLLAKALAKHVVHGQVVTKGKDGYATHDAVIGTVTAVSPTSITVKASDGYSETFSVTSSTKVRLRTDGKGAKATIADVHDGDSVAALGSEKGDAGTTSTPAATAIVDVRKS